MVHNNKFIMLYGITIDFYQFNFPHRYDINVNISVVCDTFSKTLKTTSPLLNDL